MSQNPSLKPIGSDVEDPKDTNDWPKGDEFIEMVRELKSELAKKSDECELLKIKLDETNRNIDSLNQELNESKFTAFEIDEDSRKSHEEFVRSKKLEEDYTKLMKNFLDLGEKSEQYRQSIFDKFIARSNVINSLECLYSSRTLNIELEQTKSDFSQRQAELSLAQAKVRSLEEENSIKDKSITELRKTLDDARVTHKHEINVLEEYIQSLKNTINSYEKTLSDYSDPKSQDI